MPKPVRFAVVGLGMGHQHGFALRRARGCELVAVCDLDPDRLRRSAETHGCRAYASYREVLADPEVEVVSIATESGYHAQMGRQAARAGKHIVMEKPADTTPARVHALARAVEEAGVKCGCVFQARVDPCNAMLKKALDQGKLGKLIGLHGSLPWLREDAYFSGPHGAWRGTWKLDGGGSLMNQGIHTLDLLVFFGGPVARVAGFHAVHGHDIETEDQAVACLEFANGALGTLFTTTCARPEGAQSIFGYGTRGSFRTTANKLSEYAMGGPKERARMLARHGADGEAGRDDAAKDPMAVALSGHRVLFEDMAKAVREDREPLITLDTAAHSVAVACAIYKSGRSGRTVTVDR